MTELHENKESRREFLNSIWKYLGLIAMLEAVVISLTMMRSRTSKGNERKGGMKPIASLANVPPGSVIPFRSGRFYLIRLEDGGLMAISMICTHLGCVVNWDMIDNVFKCPCHASSFDKLGNVIKSPATRALNYHRVRVENGQVLVDLENFLVRKKFDPSVVTYI
jgi:cytochrome b6-f complex iron-sulfur subunit